MQGLHVHNEIGTLKSVLLHRPGFETKSYPENAFGQVFTLRPNRSNFDLDKATQEHERLVSILEANGVEVLLLTDLLEETLTSSSEAREALLDRFCDECGVRGSELKRSVRAWIEQKAAGGSLIDALIGSICYGDIFKQVKGDDRLANLVDDPYPADALLVNPFSTMFFTRDPASVIGSTLSLNHMYWSDREREVAFYQVIFSHHPRFAGCSVAPEEPSSYHIEGGDVVNLDARNVAVGLSQRTEAAAIDVLARRLLWSENSEIESVWAVRVPEDNLCIHLDTFLSRADVETFIVDPELLDHAEIYRIVRGRKKGTCRIKSLDGGVSALLKQSLGISAPTLISCGGSMSERRHNAASVLALAPGKVCVYEENKLTNEALYRAGIDLFPVSIDELTSGYGGPSCLCLPLWREDC
ncbi:arginine deiminase [Collinsella provencensis]|uniref:arginine deiminase n=1 Tax=Collinsella provencensis TaxID=1937461 RepID=UPI000C846084|nr:arginine deiminase family protein [Collinsella provencensis]